MYGLVQLSGASIHKARPLGARPIERFEIADFFRFSSSL